MLLGNPPPSTYFKWKKQQAGNLPRDVLERISYILGIYKALQILLPDPARADGWIKAPNAAPLFAGRSGARIACSAGTSAISMWCAEYLDAERG